MPRRLAPVLLLALAASACGPTERPAPVPPPPPATPRSPGAVGLDRVMNQTAPTILALLGTPVLDLREGPARKIQFRSPACVLDAYLYPPEGGGDPKVKWIDTRTPSGADFDRASCISSLARVPEPVTPHTVPRAAHPDRRRR